MRASGIMVIIGRNEAARQDTSEPNRSKQRLLNDFSWALRGAFTCGVEASRSSY
jgi:hypothetical protein